MALTDISFDIREGEIRAIIGPNGAGKSSLMRVLGGLERPETGQVAMSKNELYPALRNHPIDTIQESSFVSGVTSVIPLYFIFRNNLVLFC